MAVGSLRPQVAAGDRQPPHGLSVGNAASHHPRARPGGGPFSGDTGHGHGPGSAGCGAADGAGRLRRARLALVVGVSGAGEVLGQLVDTQLIRVERPGAVRGPGHEGRRDGRRDQLEETHEDQRCDDERRAQPETEPDQREVHTDALRLGPVVYPGEQIPEAEDADAGRQGERRAEQETDGGDDVGDRVPVHGAISSSLCALTSASARAAASSSRLRASSSAATSSGVLMRRASRGSTAAYRATATDEMKPTRARAARIGMVSRRRLIAASRATAMIRMLLMMSRATMRSSELGPFSTRMMVRIAPMAIMPAEIRPTVLIG